MKNYNYQTPDELLSYLFKCNPSEIELPIDINKIALDLKIYIISDPRIEIGTQYMSEINLHSDPVTLVLNPYENTYNPRRRFTIAHAIAHFILHREQNISFIDTRETMGRTSSFLSNIETEANKFAADLLMPTTAIIKQAKNIIQKIKQDMPNDPISSFVQEMAVIFEVPHKAMLYKLQDLNIIA
jgi:hypothetical protein